MRRRQKQVAWLSTGLVIIVLTQAVLEEPDYQQIPQNTVPTLRSVSVIKVTAQTHSVNIVATGELQSLWQTQLSSETSGQVLSISERFREGVKLYKGEWLLTIEQSAYRKKLDTALAQLADAELGFQQAQSQMSQARKGVSLAISYRENSHPLRLHEYQLYLAKTVLNAANSNVALAKQHLNLTKLVARYNG